MSTEQEKFEAWAVRNLCDVQRGVHDTYMHGITRDMWAAWQARAAVEIAPAAAADTPRKWWPFIETPGQFTHRLQNAISFFDGDLLAAVRSVLIENPPAFAAPAAPADSVTAIVPPGCCVRCGQPWPPVAAHDDPAPSMSMFASREDYKTEMRSVAAIAGIGVVFEDEADAPEAEPSWQPIDTAPKSRKSVLVWCPENKCTFSASWDENTNSWHHFGGYWTQIAQTPTHWRPMPAPPHVPTPGTAL